MEKEILKTRMPQQKRGIETRKRILEAAWVLFSRDGYNGTNAKEITAEAGVSVGSFYAYFKDKKELFMELTHGHMKQEILAMMDRMQDLPLEKIGKKETIRHMIQLIADIHNQDPELHREIEALKYKDPDILAFDEELNDHFNKRFISFLKHFEDRLRIIDLEAAAKVISCSVQETIHAVRLFESPIGEERMIDALAEMIHRYLFK
ncbi:MAG: Transcriptional regulator, AcrR family [Olavius algarvensis Delta 4 endosymbiont]|nr:MAG: Transcriptional regulator, AcrR family [Olavius algarvensis Delta 4 endosymbiont]